MLVGFAIIASIRDRSGQFNTPRLYISFAISCAFLTSAFIIFPHSEYGFSVPYFFTSSFTLSIEDTNGCTFCIAVDISSFCFLLVEENACGFSILNQLAHTSFCFACIYQVSASFWN